VLAFALGALLVLPGCGGGSNGKPIPRDQASRLLALLQLADQNAADGKCAGADAKVREAQTVVDQLPASVDKDVRTGLADGLDRLRALIASQCKRPAPPATTPTQTTQTTTTQTQTTPTDTTPTDTTPTTPTTTDTTTTTTPPTSTGTGTAPVPTGNGGVPTGTGAAGTGAAGGNGQ
jgi:hypothetical protein